MVSRNRNILDGLLGCGGTPVYQLAMSTLQQSIFYDKDQSLQIYTGYVETLFQGMP